MMIRYCILSSAVWLSSPLLVGAWTTTTSTTGRGVSSYDPFHGQQPAIATATQQVGYGGKVSLLHAQGDGGGVLDGNKDQSDGIEDDDWSSATNKKSQKKNRSKKSSSSSSMTESGRFATGEDLIRLRHDIARLQENLHWTKALHQGENNDNQDRIADIEKAIQNGQKRDPDCVYANLLNEIAQTKANIKISTEERKDLLDQLQEKAAATRTYLARFQLEGLWVGNFGTQYGEQIINVTYAGDRMVATKVTGDDHIPRGEVSFTADLASKPSTASSTPTSSPKSTPLFSSSPTSKSSAESPPQTAADSSNYYQDAPSQFQGKGQVAKKGFLKNRYVNGKLQLFDDHFTFTWIDTDFEVTFQRPNPKQVLDLLRDDLSKEDEVSNMRRHVERCFDMDMTDSIARQHAAAAASENNEEEWPTWHSTGKKNRRERGGLYVDGDPIRRISTTSELQALEERFKHKQEIKNKATTGASTTTTTDITPWNLWRTQKTWRKYFESVLRTGGSSSSSSKSGSDETVA